MEENIIMNSVYLSPGFNICQHFLLQYHIPLLSGVFFFLSEVFKANIIPPINIST